VRVAVACPSPSQCVSAKVVLLNAESTIAPKRLKIDPPRASEPRRWPPNDDHLSDFSRWLQPNARITTLESLKPNTILFATSIEKAPCSGSQKRPRKRMASAKLRRKPTKIQRASTLSQTPFRNTSLFGNHREKVLYPRAVDVLESEPRNGMERHKWP
jgi:hypothetical protein